jgi:sterol desaturase/sphingolipid hydroxylase (fatty acid hydroxylase superfamily)
MALPLISLLRFHYFLNPSNSLPLSSSSLVFHHRWFYKRFHKQHHTFKTSVALNTEYAHPLEHLISNVLTTFGGPLLLGSHVLVFWSYFAFRLWETFDGHSGYTIPILSPFSVVPWWTGPQMHDFHHSHNIGAFGTMTCFWDWACGTDKAYRLFAAKEKEKYGRKEIEGIDKVAIKEDEELETKRKMYEGNVWKKADLMYAQ